MTKSVSQRVYSSSILLSKISLVLWSHSHNSRIPDAIATYMYLYNLYNLHVLILGVVEGEWAAVANEQFKTSNKTINNCFQGKKISSKFQ